MADRIERGPNGEPVRVQHLHIRTDALGKPLGYDDPDVEYSNDGRPMRSPASAKLGPDMRPSGAADDWCKPMQYGVDGKPTGRADCRWELGPDMKPRWAGGPTPRL